MDKPISLSVKDYLIRRMAVKMMLSEKTIEAVNHQFQSANEAFYQPSIFSMEIGGLGKFFYNEKKAKNKLDDLLSIRSSYEKSLDDENISENKKNTLLKKMDSVNEDISFLKTKLNINESISNLRRMEEQCSSSKEIEECNISGVSK